MMTRFAALSLVWSTALYFQSSATTFGTPASNDSTAKDSVLASNCNACRKHHQKMTQADPDYEKALEYAPILWFADQEEYFPVMPFFSAFDGLNNDADDEVWDFDDPQEIAPSAPDKSAPEDDLTKLKLASWETLRKWYNRLLDEENLNAMAENRKNTGQMRINALQAKVDSLNRGIEYLASIVRQIPIGTPADSLQPGIDPDAAEEQARRFLEQLDQAVRGPQNLRHYQDSLSALKKELERFSTDFAVDQFKAKAKAAAKKRLCIVFYNISKRMKVRDLKTELNNDEQFWHRLEQDYKDYFAKTRAGLTVFEYYFYYVYDKGLGHHPQDIERVFVYVPDSANFRVIAAAGHSNLTPNNVLFYKTDEVPEQYKSHLHILVELGGHSNAPDLKGNGLFEPGVDANWHIENLWGTRDMQARAGSGALGQYASWMTFPRDLSGKVFPPDPALENVRPEFCYRLLPVRNFRALDDLLSRYAKREEATRNSTSGSDDIDSTKRSLIDEIDRNFAAIGLPSTKLTNLIANNEILGKEVDARMHPLLLWRKDMSVLTRTKTSIPPSKKFFQGSAYWFDFEYGHKDEFHFDLPKARVALLFRPPWLLPGVLELHGGVDLFELGASSQGLNMALGVIYEKYYTAWRLFPLSYYGGVLGHVDLEPGRKDYLNFQFGLSAALPLFFQHDNTLRKFRLRLGGVSRDVEFWKKPRFNLQLGYHFQPIPLTDEPYVKLNSKKHKIWKHDDYDRPEHLFKRFLFRRRGPIIAWVVNSFGVWVDCVKKESPAYKASWLMPVRGVLPVKIDGVLELQAGWNGSNVTPIKNWTAALYYERLFGRLPSWYVNISCSKVSHLALDDLGGGLSVMFPMFAGKRFFGSNNFYWPPWIHLRLGIKSSMNREALQLSRPRLELQLGIH